MENCIYQGKMICTYDLKDENGLYYEDQVLVWKEAAADRRLHCVECSAPVYLAAGPVKEPYFAHYDTLECDYESGQESEELKKGKRLIYQLLRRSYPERSIQARYRLENGMYGTLFCDNRDQPMVIDYRLVNNSLTKFRERDDYYQTHRIKVIYILGVRQEKNTKQLDWYQNLLQKAMGYVAFLDVEKEELILRRSYGYRLGAERHFKSVRKNYRISELTMDETGQMLCDFDALCDKLVQQIEEENRSYQRTQDKLKQLREERQRLEEEEQKRMEEYRRRMETVPIEPIVQIEPLEPMEPRPRLTRRSDEEILALGLNPVIYEKCIHLIEQGDGHLVAKKYYDAIMKSV